MVSALQVEVEKVGSSLAKVKLSVPADEFEREISRGLKQVGSQVRMKGFRPGKVPLSVLKKHHGAQVLQQVRENFLRDAYTQAVKDESLKPLSHPKVDLESLTDEAGQGFDVDFEIALRPEIVLPEYKGLTIESELEPVMADGIQATIDDLRRQQSRPEPAGDAGLDEEGIVLCDVSFHHEEDSLMERENLRLSAKTPPPGVDAEAFEKAMLGAKDGDTIEVEALLPDTLEKESARGQQGTCRILVREAYRMLPPTEEELFAVAQVDSQEALQKLVKERMEEAHEERERVRVETALIDRLIADTDLELPEPIIEEQTQGRLQQLHKQLEEQGLEHDAIHAAMDEQRPTAREEAIKGLRALLIVETVGEKEGLLVTNEELEAELASIAERNNASVDEVRQYYSQQGLGQQMAIEILERKVRKFLHENADIRTPS